MGSTAPLSVKCLSNADRLEISYKAARAAHLPSKHLLRTLVLARAKELAGDAKPKRKQLKLF